MTFREQLEVLRGEPIKVFVGNPLDIPCIETSDAGKLCKHPVVSVHMMAYNHEQYIRQAIEGVMMQKTDFEFELVVGEDASTDKTREICFEYQKKFPDKIRILWWHENLRVVNHPAGGNNRRVLAHCRGEFVAYCEGDDWWIDPLKLQKQIDAMRKHPSVGLCFSDAKWYLQSEDRYEDRTCEKMGNGLVRGRKFLLYHLFGADPRHPHGTEGFVMTATILLRRSFLEEAAKRFDVFNWGLCLGDKVLLFGLSAVSDVYHLSDKTAVYRRSGTGMMTIEAPRVLRDSAMLRMYFPKEVFGLAMHSLPEFVLKRYEYWAGVFYRKSRIVALAKCILGIPVIRTRCLVSRRSFLLYWCGLIVVLVERILLYVFDRLRPAEPWPVSARVKKLYCQYC